MATVDDCTDALFLDRTAADADRTFAWNFPFAGDPERCITIRAGQTVTWVGPLPGHPLQADEGDQPTPIPMFLDQGASVAITFPQPGTFGYRCHFHSEIRGAIKVVPAAPAATVPWAGPGHGVGLAGTLVMLAVLILRRPRRHRV